MAMLNFPLVEGESPSLSFNVKDQILEVSLLHSQEAGVSSLEQKNSIEDGFLK